MADWSQFMQCSTSGCTAAIHRYKRGGKGYYGWCKWHYGWKRWMEKRYVHNPTKVMHWIEAKVGRVSHLVTHLHSIDGRLEIREGKDPLTCKERTPNLANWTELG